MEMNEDQIKLTSVVAVYDLGFEYLNMARQRFYSSKT